MSLRTYIRLMLVFGAIVVVMGLLSGCATQPQPQPPIEKPVEVKVPVEVPCKAPKVEKPALPINSLPANASLAVKVRAILDSLDLEMGYAGQLEAAVAACQ
ncbi:MAG: hypothetical protein QJR04_25225 [Burkholderia multivorans]|nr:hypothetical protein [Burkholderia multivorans]